AIAAEPVDTVSQRCEVGGGVAVAPVALSHDERKRVALAVREALREHAERSVALDKQPRALEVSDDRVKLVVVRRLARDVLGLQADVQEAIHRVEVTDGLLDEDSPQGQGLVVAVLQRDDAAPAALREGLVGVELLPGFLVEGVKVADRESLR